MALSIQIKNGQTVLLREAVKEDAPELITYLYKIGGESDFLTFEADELNISLSNEEALLEESRNAKNKIMILTLVNNKVIGCLHFAGGSKKRTKQTGEFGVSVLKDYWHQGIGTAMLEELIQWAKDSNVIRKINLRVRSDNDRAVNLYKRLGFVQEGLITREFLISGQLFDLYCMGLNID